MLRYTGPEGFGLGLLASILPFVIVVASRPLLDRYYASRFGNVAKPLEQRWMDILPGAMLLVGGVVIDASTLARAARARCSLPAHSWQLHVAVRDWPWRGHYLIPAICCAIGAWMTATVPAMRIDTLEEMLRIGFTILMVPQVIAACLDHRLLTAVLPLNRQAALADAADVARE